MSDNQTSQKIPQSEFSQYRLELQQAKQKYKLKSVLLIFVTLLMILLFCIQNFVSLDKNNVIKQISQKQHQQVNKTQIKISKNKTYQDKNKIQIKISQNKTLNLKIIQKEVKVQILSQQNKTKKDQIIPQKIQEAEKYVTPKLQKILKDGRYFDIHYFVDDQHIKQAPRVINKAKPRNPQDAYQQRQFLKIDKSKQQLQRIIHEMKYPDIRPKELPQYPQATKPQIIDLAFFANSLNLHPDNNSFQQAEFTRFDQLYSISKYGKQLPLCLVMVGNNNGNVIIKMYDSIRRQNYTNYRIIQVDDNSNDNTINKTIEYLQKYPFLKERTSVIVTRYERNALFNRHYANIYYCQDEDIVIDLDSDDWLIGNQVFQLVNSVYQAGNIYKGVHQQIWSAFFNNILYRPWSFCCPRVPLFGKFADQVYQKKSYRSVSWRTTHLRTYLWKLYLKIDEQDYVDSINIKKGQYYAESPDVYMMFPILQMSAPKHTIILDEFVYFYTGSADRDQTYPFYTMFQGRNLPIYLPLQNINDNPVRGPIMATDAAKKSFQQNRKKSIERLQDFKKKVLQLYETNKKQIKSNQSTKLQLKNENKQKK